MAKKDETSRFSHLDGRNWMVAVEEFGLQRLREQIRQMDPSPARKLMVADLAAREQMLASLKATPKDGGIDEGVIAV